MKRTLQPNTQSTLADSSTCSTASARIRAAFWFWGHLPSCRPCHVAPSPFPYSGYLIPLGIFAAVAGTQLFVRVWGSCRRIALLCCILPEGKTIEHTTENTCLSVRSLLLTNSLTLPDYAVFPPPQATEGCTNEWLFNSFRLFMQSWGLLCNPSQVIVSKCALCN